MSILCFGLSSGVIRRCYACRSRGELGDCRDPFFTLSNAANNASVEINKAGVETPPCASGWCSKILEGVDKSNKDDDYGSATQRDCLQRPPSDGEERCAYVSLNRKKVFMCFCQGDLCNNSSIIQNSFVLITIGAFVNYYYGKYV